MKLGFKIRELMLTGPMASPATISFKDGLNVITGPSNTGKTYVFQCINYMLGSSNQPKDIPEARKYNKIYLEIETGDKSILSLESDLTGGDFKLYRSTLNNLSEHNFELLRRAHDSKKDDNISKFLLNLNNLSDKKILTNSDGSTRKISYSDVRKLILIDEHRILTDKSPILTGQYVNKTEEESFFKFILTGVDDSGIVKGLSQKQISNRKGRLELLNELIIKSETEKNYSIKIPISSIEKELTDIDTKIKSLENEYTILSALYEKLLENKNDLHYNLTEAKSKHLYYKELLLRSSLLHQQYDSDVRRLEATLEASIHLLSHNKLMYHCPLCGEILQDKPEDDEIQNIIESCNKEKEKILILKGELEKSEILLRSEQRVIQVEIGNMEDEVRRITLELEKKIGDRLRNILIMLNEFNTLKNSKIEHLLHKKNIDSLFQKKKEISESIEQQKQHRTQLTTSLVHPLSQTIKSTLESCKYPDLSDVSFSELKEDFVISGRDRELHGKGYRAIIFSVFIMALQEYIYDKNFSLGVPVLDSPLVTYKKPSLGIGDNDTIPLDLAMDFYRYVAQSSKLQQVIILENEEPPNDIKDLINHVRFTQSSKDGRYGFIPV